jgi:hypothetical protein
VVLNIQATDLVVKSNFTHHVARLADSLDPVVADRRCRGGDPRHGYGDPRTTRCDPAERDH